MSILEAYAYGCPVLLNKKSCFPEIATNAAIYFDTDNKKSIIDSLVSIYNCSQQEREDLINRGYCRLSTFSWKNSAKQLAKVYQSIV